MRQASVRATGMQSCSARRSSTAAAWLRWREKTAGTPALRIPAFSPAMASRLRPRKASWSKSMGVITHRSGSHDVGGVQASAQADFEYDDVHGFLGEDIESHGGDGFKVRGVQVDCAGGQQLLHGGMHAVEGAGETLGGDGPAIDLDALGGFGEVGRGEESGAPPRGAQGGFDHGAGGAFAVGAGDVDEAGAVLRAAERVEYLSDTLEAEFGGLDFVAERVEEVDGIGVVHFKGGVHFNAEAQRAQRSAQRKREAKLHT